MSEIKIKREIRNKKYYMVARLNGRFSAIRRWSKDFNSKKAVSLYKQNNTFNPKVRKERLTGSRTAKQRGYYINEVVDERKIRRSNIPTKISRIQFSIKALLKNGDIVTARSMQRDRDYPIDKLRDEAYQNFYMRVASALGLAYDEDVGREQQDQITSIKEGLVYYDEISYFKGNKTKNNR